MQIKLVHGANRDDAATLEIYVNGEGVLSAYPLYECPEDASLERDMGFVYQIPDLMRAAYEAGKNGEPFEIIEEGEE